MHAHVHVGCVRVCGCVAQSYSVHKLWRTVKRCSQPALDAEWWGRWQAGWGWGFAVHRVTSFTPQRRFDLLRTLHHHPEVPSVNASGVDLSTCLGRCLLDCA